MSWTPMTSKENEASPFSPKIPPSIIKVPRSISSTPPATLISAGKALELDLPVIVCINKIDRPEARPDEVIDEVLELFMDLNASDEQLDCPFVYASAKTGVASMDPEEEGTDMKPLFETILNYIPAPEGDPDAHTQVLISTIDYNEYVGRIGIGKVDNGTIRVGMDAVVVNKHDPDRMEKVRISKLYEFDGLNKVSPVSRTCPSATPSALRKTRRPSPSRRFPSRPLPCSLLLMTVLLQDRKENTSPPAISETVCSGS